jgi:hypothetical protein
MQCAGAEDRFASAGQLLSVPSKYVAQRRKAPTTPRNLSSSRWWLRYPCISTERDTGPSPDSSSRQQMETYAFHMGCPSQGNMYLVQCIALQHVYIVIALHPRPLCPLSPLRQCLRPSCACRMPLELMTAFPLLKGDKLAMPMTLRTTEGDAPSQCAYPTPVHGFWRDFDSSATPRCLDRTHCFSSR